MKNLSIIICLISLSQILNAQNSCTTPNGQSGSCISLRQCDKLYQILIKSPISPSDRNFLRQSQCGYSSNTPQVCCEIERTIPDPTTNRIRYSENDLPRPGVCGSKVQSRIVGGTRTGISEFPWMALLEYSKPNGKKGFHCGGVLINNNYVLTASHCVNGAGVTRLRYRLTSVRLGEWDLENENDCDEEDICSDPVRDIPIAESISHENYVPRSQGQLNDIALLRLARSVTYSDWIKPICLPVSAQLKSKNFNGALLTVAGWGKTENASSSNVKLQVGVDGVSNSECNKVYNQINVQIDPKQLCAGGVQGQDSCSGDSGGPLMALDSSDSSNPIYFSAGIVSFGPTKCGLSEWPGVYTRTSEYMNWILDHMQS